MTELKLCPFCNSNAELKYVCGEYFIMCPNCKCSSDTSSIGTVVIRAWNKRSDNEAPEYKRPKDASSDKVLLPESELEKIKKIVDDINKRFKDATMRFNMFQDSFVMQELSDIIKDLDKINKIREKLI